jgi:capsular polysaccharide export protein
MSTRPKAHASIAGRTTIDVRYMARGKGIANWLSARPPLLCIDTRAGRALARIATATGVAVQPVCSGPLPARPTAGTPPLSWFSIPADLVKQGSLIAALERQLLTSFQMSPSVDRLMRRVLETDALHFRPRIAALPEWWHSSNKTRIILIDERAASHTDFQTSPSGRSGAFAAMVQAARSAYPGAQICLLRSADAGAGHWLSSRIALPAGIAALQITCSLRDALTQTDALYVVGASEGMAALLAGVPVHVFGTPYYAGWGLTHDHADMTSRTARPTLAALFDAVFAKLAVYLDPQTGRPGTLEAVLESIELQHAVAARYADLEQIAAVDFQYWKRPYATPYLTAGGSTLRWVRHATERRADECAAIWGGRHAAGLEDGTRRVRIEDGFIHSIGLGSDMSPPFSQVIDRRGLYFDASQPNDLTTILNTTKFDEPELRRAAALRQEMVRLGITKYNLGRCAPNWRPPQGRRTILVAGQVADDASIRLGTRQIATSEALLEEVRAHRPDAFIVYKPHPDVLSGNRTGLVDAARFADVVDTAADLVSLIDAVDEVHTISSLAGFDALIRGKQVHTYGLPFYAGWGLTVDALPQPWRERSVTLDMLTAGVLLRYPIYWDWNLALFTTPEAIVHQIADAAARPLDKIRGNRMRPFIKATRWCRNVLRYAAWHRQFRLANKGTRK